ncbi:MAG TPA: hypothetical protein VHU86_07445 [Solirubrobacterales bacterium]|jgi:hypothetical protein|nr:hypothetical protein [Solirubrobacterales bacterium]
MRSRGTAAKPVRPKRHGERRPAPQHSTFRRVAVFVPYSASGAPTHRPGEVGG